MIDKIVAGLGEIVGAPGIVTGDAVQGREFPWMTHQACPARAIVYPMSTQQVSSILRFCNGAGQPVVPFGGTTNLVQGCASSAEDIVLSLERMNGLEMVDSAARTLTAQAGMTMQAAQDAATEAGLFFPVDIGARSNCQLGGIVSMNAGGTKVIRYGMTRDSVLGLEAVLADGTVISSMNHYIKNNSGFDLKQLFIGSEGVLGIVTRVVFRLRARPRTHNVALLACKCFEDVVAILGIAQDSLLNTLTAFEVMWDSFYQLAVQPRGRLAAPLQPGSKLYVLVESMGVDQEHDAGVFEAMLESLMDKELLVDGTMAKSDRERDLLWEIRDEVEPVIGGALNFDVSMNCVDVGNYLERVDAVIKAQLPGANVVGFGHLGDNNVHVSVALDDQSEGNRRIIEDVVYGQLVPLNGAISAEHGIGLEKRPFLPLSRTAQEIELMTSLKRSLDPNNILNPGKVIDAG